ncbi:TRAP transporter small permease [Mariluticola halotolerans]|uniref:TRAP transporter small permease n=1 Tax=Mariluticola halotolerans TaxID=2909283 RepID=UPI0026E13111|nr:TRAP transporter small permease subunit [Mariluticola halotolerans]UJQ94777.1 TRAP transporter small permease subunit [Mariluticola halotolerans]
MRLSHVGAFLKKRAENVLALMLGIMFLAFIAQVVFRYFLNFPIGWTSELTVVMWLWIVLWGAAFVVREDEEIRFDLVYGAVPPGARRGMTVVFAIALLVIYLFSFPAVLDYVLFMKVQATAYLKIRFDLLFSIYILFAVAVIFRYGWLLWGAVTGRAVEILASDDVGTKS